MQLLLGGFFNGDYMPHGHCYLWQPGILWVNVLSDALIALAYFTIPVALFLFVRKRKELKYRGIFILFALFILLCGLTHLFSIYTIWHGWYGTHGLLKAATAAVSVTTAITLFLLLPRLLTIPTPAQLQAVQERAIRDPLTDLPNRAALHERLAALLGNLERNPNSLALALLDLDGFKPVNDQMGHKAGDDILLYVASRLRKGLRRSDMAARLGGDEFVLVLTNFKDRTALQALLDEKRQQLIQPMLLYTPDGIKRVEMGVSIGVAEWQPGVTARQLIARADNAMYDSKALGANHITFAD